MKKRRVKIGDVFEITLPNGQMAYGRLFKDSVLGIYKNEKRTTYDFFVGIYSDVLQDPDWTIIDSIPFVDEDDAWPPKNFIKDKISGDYSIYYKGEIIDSSYEECKGLESASVWGKTHLIDRLMGDDKWTVIA